MSDSKAVQHVTDSTFDQSVLNAGMPALVDFWAPWCGPCRIIGPLIEELAREGNIRVEKRGSRWCWATKIYLAEGPSPV